MTTTLLAAEAPSFDEPIAMLIACHDRVRHYAQLSGKLALHLAEGREQAQAVAAARSILRYFDVAAPLHHDDEDIDLYPALLSQGESELRLAIAEITAEHEELLQLWSALRVSLLRLTQGESIALSPEQCQIFAMRYCAHADREEREIYPAASRLLSADFLQALGQRMAARRQGATA